MSDTVSLSDLSMYSVPSRMSTQSENTKASPEPSDKLLFVSLDAILRVLSLEQPLSFFRLFRPADS